MAACDTVHKLAQGVQAWNAYRSNVNGTPDLTGIKIYNASLSGVDFHAVDLDGAELRNVDLRRSNLRAARINGVTADGVCLDDSSINDAEMKGTDFDRSCLRRCQLKNLEAYELRIRRSILADAVLRGARLRGHTHIYNCDLTGVDTTDLLADSGVVKRPIGDPSALERLKVQGLALMDLVNSPILSDHPNCDEFSINVPDEQYGLIVSGAESYWISEGRYDVFLSHVSKYKTSVAKPLADALENLGLRVWIDELRIGLLDNLADIIGFGIRSSRFGVVLLTRDFFGRYWTDREFSALVDRRVFLVLHEVTPEELTRFHPDLFTARLVLSSDLGSAEVASRIYSAIRRPPRILG